MNLFLYFLFYFFAAILSIGSPIPNGVFMPCIIMGAISGRLYGEIISDFMEVEHVGGYALVGSASLTDCVTRTTSVSIIILELSG